MNQIVYFGSNVHDSNVHAEIGKREPYIGYAAKNREIYILDLLNNSLKGKELCFVSTAYGKKSGPFKTLNVKMNSVSYSYLGYWGAGIIRLVSSFIVSFLWILKNIKSKTIVVTYNFPVVYSIPLLLKKMFSNYKIIIEFEDFFNKNDYRYYFYHPFELLGIKLADAFIASSKGMHNYLISKKEGSKIIINSGYHIKSLRNFHREHTHKKISFLFSGSLDPERGILKLLSLFHHNKNEKYELIITGKGPLYEKVLQESVRDPRIKYLGIAPNDEYNRLLNNVDICLNMQKSEIDINFPSKITHYLSFGNVVFTTRNKSLIESPFSVLLEYFDDDCNNFWDLVYNYERNMDNYQEKRDYRRNAFLDIMETQERSIANFMNNILE